MIDAKTRKHVRDLLRALERVFPALRDTDRAYRALTQPDKRNQGIRKKGWRTPTADSLDRRLV